MVLSTLVKESDEDAPARSWWRSVRFEQVMTSCLVIGEIRFGIADLRRRAPERAHRLDLWLARLAEELRDRVLPVTDEVAAAWAELRLQVPRSDPIDRLIAATARTHGLTVVTRNVRDFARFGVPVINPDEPRP